MDDLERFELAQEGSYERALAELRAGRKRSHWMWYVFPQLAGLGRSATAREYAIRDLGQAQAYLRHPALGPRLIEAARAAAASHAATAEELLGAVDALKLRSSMTLFALATADLPDLTDARVVFDSVLARYYAGAPDPLTLALLRPAP